MIRLLGKLCRRKIASCDQVGLRGYESVRGRHLIGYAIVLFLVILVYFTFVVLYISLFSSYCRLKAYLVITFGSEKVWQSSADPEQIRCTWTC